MRGWFGVLVTVFAELAPTVSRSCCRDQLFCDCERLADTGIAASERKPRVASERAGTCQSPLVGKWTVARDCRGSIRDQRHDFWLAVHVLSDCGQQHA